LEGIRNEVSLITYHGEDPSSQEPRIKSVTGERLNEGGGKKGLFLKTYVEYVKGAQVFLKGMIMEEVHFTI